MKLAGRNKEIETLHNLLLTEQSEFLAVYGRRRVGKTFLIRETYKKHFTFYHTGLANSDSKTQLKNFNSSLQKHGKMPYPMVRNWFDAFEQLIHLIENSKQKGKKVIFLDELPWLDTARSGFISALEHFWNSWAEPNGDVLVIVCGSATSWMINKLIKNKGGLHNRITRKMHIEPFTLGECESFFKSNKIIMDRRQMIECYMIFGGIPYYLSLIEKSLSLAQNVDAICFAKHGALSEEFNNLYNSLFKYSENHIKIVSSLSKKNKGLTRKEIVSTTKIADGGGLSKILEELEQCGFINKYRTFGNKSKNTIYQLVDFFSLFYFNFIEANQYKEEHFWTNFAENARHKAWSGYSFEQVCLSHTKQIKHKLGITGVLSNISSWRNHGSEKGAQIDLIIDRNDRIINLCEIKFSNSEFAITKSYDQILQNKKAVFLDETKTKKGVHLTMITTYGLKRNEYWGNIQSEVKMNDLFITL
jgi:AAA+ ATPase superfamily predicted ATPase